MGNSNLINAKCTNCGAELKVEKDKEAMICNHCGSAFIVSKAIENYNYTTNNYNNYTADVINVINGDKDYQVVSGSLKKYNGSASKIVIPDEVKVIRNGAFADCVYIEEFHLSSLVKAIEKDSFQEGTEIDALYFNGTLEEFINLDDKSLLKKFSKKLIIDEKEVDEITITSDIAKNLAPHCLESNNWIKSVIVEEGVKSLPAFAFCFCKNLEKVKLSSTLTEIGPFGFYGCRKLKEINLKETNLFRIECFTFGDCEKLENITMPYQITAVDLGAFKNCINLETVTFQQSRNIDIGFVNDKSLNVLNCKEDLKGNSEEKKLLLEDLELKWTGFSDRNTSYYTCFGGCENLKDINTGNAVFCMRSGTSSRSYSDKDHINTFGCLKCQSYCSAKYEKEKGLFKKPRLSELVCEKCGVHHHFSAQQNNFESYDNFLASIQKK